MGDPVSRFVRLSVVAVSSLAFACNLTSSAPDQAPSREAAAFADHHHEQGGGIENALFVNGGFEDGSLGGWTVTTPRNTSSGFAYPPASISDLRLQSSGSSAL